MIGVAKGLTRGLVGVRRPEGKRSKGLLWRLAIRFGVEAPNSIGDIEG
jgi:hypothetical protein